MTAKDEALEDYYDELSKVQPPDNKSCFALANYTAQVLECIKRLYDVAYSNGFNDAVNIKIDE